ncbi:MAG: YihY/virulence factor BrkB family protein [Gemmatimonadales bacterium]
MREGVRVFWEKFNDDDAFFLAGGIAWGVLFALVPLLALGIGLTGFVLSARFDDPTEAVIALFAGAMPQTGAAASFADMLQNLVTEVMANRAGLTLVGALVFIWLATRLSGSVRSALFRVFEVGVRRGIVHGKMFDMVAVMAGVLLVTLNLGVTVVFTAAMAFGVEIFGLDADTVTIAQRLMGASIAFASIWTLFLLAYRYLPARRTPWRTTIVAATFAALAHELLKLAFSTYVTELANYTSTLGNLATAAILLLWIYYGALVFIVGGEVAHVYTMLRARRA